MQGLFDASVLRIRLCAPLDPNPYVIELVGSGPITLCTKTAPKSVLNSVADPFHFDTAPDPGIRFVEKRTRI